MLHTLLGSVHVAECHYLLVNICLSRREDATVEDAPLSASLVAAATAETLNQGRIYQIKSRSENSVRKAKQTLE